MKHASMLVALVAFLAAPALAEEGRVSKSTLNAIGLSGMQDVSDADGAQVRGKIQFSGAVKGTSLIFGQLLTPDTKNFVVLTSVNEVDGDASNVGDPILAKDHASFIGFLDPVAGTFTPATLSVTSAGPPAFSYFGSMRGITGGTGSVSLFP